MSAVRIDRKIFSLEQDDKDNQPSAAEKSVAPPIALYMNILASDPALSQRALYYTYGPHATFVDLPRQAEPRGSRR